MYNLCIVIDMWDWIINEVLNLLDIMLLLVENVDLVLVFVVMFEDDII